MSKIKWDQVGERKYETGVDRGVRYPMSETGTYPKGVAWNGLSAITESPSGAEATAVYADNQKYLNLFCRKSRVDAEDVKFRIPVVAAALSLGETREKRERLLAWVNEEIGTDGL